MAVRAALDETDRHDRPPAEVPLAVLGRVSTLTQGLPVHERARAPVLADRLVLCDEPLGELPRGQAYPELTVPLGHGRGPQLERREVKAAAEVGEQPRLLDQRRVAHPVFQAGHQYRVIGQIHEGARAVGRDDLALTEADSRHQTVPPSNRLTSTGTSASTSRRDHCALNLRSGDCGGSRFRSGSRGVCSSGGRAATSSPY